MNHRSFRQGEGIPEIVRLAASHPVVLFDGDCALCSRWVRFLLKRDGGGRFRFAPLQSRAGKALLGLSEGEEAPLTSVVLVEEGRIYRESTAALRILRGVPGGWKLLFGLIAVPGFLRDPVYRWVARNRYRWFGRADACQWFAAAEWRDRLVGDEG